MLTATITFQDKKDIVKYISELGFIYRNDKYVKKLSKFSTKTLTFHLNHQENHLSISFPENVTLEDCHQINIIITNIAQDFNGKVDDKKAHLGYDSNGRKVFIYHGFTSWTSYIEEAKHRSLEGQRVIVLHGDEELGRGILLAFEKSETTSLQEKSSITCTLLTTTGEQSFFGEDLNIEPMM